MFATVGAGFRGLAFKDHENLHSSVDRTGASSPGLCAFEISFATM